jgi:hypothetical protein
MGELAPLPESEPSPPIIYELKPNKNASWDMIIDAAYRDGTAYYTYEGAMYELHVEDLLPPEAA